MVLGTARRNSLERRGGAGVPPISEAASKVSLGFAAIELFCPYILYGGRVADSSIIRLMIM